MLVKLILSVGDEMVYIEKAHQYCVIDIIMAERCC